MKCPPLLFVCWCSSILAVTSCIQVDGYSCVSAYRDSITCVLNITGNPVEQPTYSLKFTDYRKAYSCPLLAANHTYSCVSFSEQQDNILVILTKSLGPVCVAAGVLLFVFYSPAARMKIKTLSHTPSPASFFQPLFQQHEGNLKEWLSPQGRYVLTYKTEEILTTDAVIVVPKPIAKDPEEKQDTRSPSVTHLPFIQCQTSYVGLPGIHEPPPPLTMVCPGEMAYTQLPCSVLGVEFKEVEVAPFPPKDFFNLSSADSGCSCEDLTQSLECSLPSSPVDNSAPPAPPAPPLCNCTDYCILNKTAEGFAPVLVSKGGSINVPSDSLQEDKS
ncbi:uncharacterized protein ABDE67_005933 [Symphorus nematophorus]